jgi:hypothetical protein
MTEVFSRRLGLKIAMPLSTADKELLLDWSCGMGSSTSFGAARRCLLALDSWTGEHTVLRFFGLILRRGVRLDELLSSISSPAMLVVELLVCGGGGLQEPIWLRMNDCQFRVVLKNSFSGSTSAIGGGICTAIRRSLSGSRTSTFMLAAAAFSCGLNCSCHSACSAR